MEIEDVINELYKEMYEQLDTKETKNDIYRIA